MEPADANFVLASWAAKLFSGINCANTDLRTSTVKGYLKAAQALMVSGGYSHSTGLPLDKRHHKFTDTYLAKVRRWEQLPHRREIISDEMLDFLKSAHLSSRRDSLDDCLFDWVALGRYTGFRASEWAQSRKLSYDLIDDKDWRESRAMIDADFVFFNRQGHLLDKDSSRTADAYRVDIRWRVQKNKSNGEVISFWRHERDPDWCPVAAAWRICQRARRRGIPAHQPLGQYFDYSRRQMVFLNTPEVEAAIRAAASFTTGITDDSILQRMFGMHSIRVTACNELARLKVSDSFIKRRLRWKSTTFLDYLRNNIHVAQRHNLALNLVPSPDDMDLRQDLRSLGHTTFSYRS